MDEVDWLIVDGRMEGKMSLSKKSDRQANAGESSENMYMSLV